MRSVLLKDRKTGKETEYNAAKGDFYGVFVFVGYAPEMNFLRGRWIWIPGLRHN